MPQQTPITPGQDTLLVILPTWLGDTVMATPAIAGLTRSGLFKRIELVARPGQGELIDGLEGVDAVHECDMKGLSSIARLRRISKDVMLLLPNSFRSALLARLSRPGRLVGYARDGRGWLLNDGVTPPPRDQPVPAVDYYCTLVSGLIGEQIIDRRLRLEVTDAQRSSVDGILGERSGPAILLNPGANRQDKRWSADRFAKVADMLSEQFNATILVSGSPGERALLDQVVTSASCRIINLQEHLQGLGQLKAIMAQVDLLITNDTGPRHIATAVDTPVVCLFGPTDPRWTTLHQAREHLLLAEPYLPSDRIADDHPGTCTIDRIQVDDVMHAAVRLLEDRHGSGA
ncbi:MAG: hypothetical protein CMJ32_00455 [Phycisphaerae bacterium]|nr:hypothetical protein [Phycisphaerae bacterium]